MVIDEAGVVVSFNPAAETTFGYLAADAVGRSIADLIVPPDFVRHSSEISAISDVGDARWLGRRVEMEAMRADGTIFPAEPR